MTGTDVWCILISSLFDWNGEHGIEIPGSNLSNWIELVQCDHNDVDRFLIDFEIIGG